MRVREVCTKGFVRGLDACLNKLVYDKFFCSWIVEQLHCLLKTPNNIARLPSRDKAGARKQRDWMPFPVVSLAVLGQIVANEHKYHTSVHYRRTVQKINSILCHHAYLNEVRTNCDQKDTDGHFEKNKLNMLHPEDTYLRSQHSHTVEKCPQPSFRITWYLFTNKSPILTGWYPPAKVTKTWSWYLNKTVQHSRKRVRNK